MKVIKEICEPGKQYNEDYLVYNYHNYVLVLDGSTGLGENRITPGEQDEWNTDAQWFVQSFSALVERYMDNDLPIKELVRECIAKLSVSYWKMVPADTDCLSQPSASMALLKKTGDMIELLSIGDLTVLIQKEDGSVIEIKDDTVSKLDSQVIKQMVKESQNRKIDVSEARQLPQIQDALDRNRMMKNTEDGYWVLGLDPEVVTHGLYRQLSMEDWNRILICSDGFYAYTDYHSLTENTPEQFMNQVVGNSLNAMIKEIRKVEHGDVGYNRYPRLKMSDDATAVLIVSNQERKQQQKNNWLLKTNIVCHRVKGKCQSSWMTFGLKKAYLFAIVTALAAIGKVAYEILQKEMTRFDLITWSSMLISALTAFLTVISTIIEYRASTHDYLIFSDPGEKVENLLKLELREKQKAAGYQIETFFNGSEKEYFIMSTQVNDYLLENKPIDMKDLKRNFTLVDEVKKYVPAVMELTFQKQQISFNGKLLRQITDLYPGISMVNVQKAMYFDGQCTQEIVYKQFKSIHEINMDFDGKHLLMDDNNFCYPLDYSSCANFLGASTMVFTRDHKIIVGRQGILSKANRGRYAPSGSGSVDYADIQRTKARIGSSGDVTLQDVLITAMEREFCEECNYPLQEGYKKMHTQVIGYARLLERGGKPDYFGVSYIKEDSKNIKRSISRSEHGMSKHFIVLHYHEASDIPQVLRKFCKEHLVARQISIQVEMITQILEHIEETQGIKRLMQKLTT